MSDFADMASEQQAYLEEVALYKHKTKRRLNPCGRCFNCDETIVKGLFCDKDCREDYEKREHMAAGAARDSQYEEFDD
jgi:hypothetical protein